MSNKFDAYDDNDEITLSSTSNNKAELQKENSKLKQELTEAYLKINEYEETILKGNIKPVGIATCNLSEDDIFNITHNSTFIIAK
jgi:hypothetical protein